MIGGITAVVVLHDSAKVIEPCLDALCAAAPQRGIEVRVVDNASRDDGAARAARRIGESRVTRLAENRGFAAGVNAVLKGFAGDAIALVNPDLVMSPGALDRLADVLDRRPRAGLVGPRVLDPDGLPEASVGRFPTLARERAHAWFLDRLMGKEGRGYAFPATEAAVDWVSGCAWLLRGEAAREVGALDEGYFMYYEDVDYCRRLAAAGWEVVSTPEVSVTHARGSGSTATSSLPADGGLALLLYFARFEPAVRERDIRRALVQGWHVRRLWHGLRAAFGSRRSANLAERFDRALRMERAPGRTRMSTPAGSLD